MDRSNNDSTGTHFLSRQRAANYLSLSPRTLAKLACIGGGPVFAKINARVIYDTRDLDRWVEARKRSSTSDVGGAQ